MMDLKGSLVSANLRIFPSEKLKNFLSSIPLTDETPNNIINLVKNCQTNLKPKFIQIQEVHLNKYDLKSINKVKETLSKLKESKNNDLNNSQEAFKIIDDKTENQEIVKNSGILSKNKESLCENDNSENQFLYTNDLDWIYAYIKKRREEGDKSLPYFHILFEGSQIMLPENDIVKRNPILEARCVKLRAQQEVREYRKMTKSVDNVRMRYPEDSISYQMKQINRQLIAIGQFIISIFAGFFFGFRGVEFMIGNLDFGFRLLLGVMCALVIALAEIYFLAKKLNEELNVPETVQLGGPSKFVKEPYFGYKNSAIEKKEHHD